MLNSDRPLVGPPLLVRIRDVGRRAVEAVARREFVLVALIVATAALSAFSFWQATMFAEEAAEQLNQQRIAAADSSHDLGLVQALVDHDLRVLSRLCGATVERDDALLDRVLEDESVETLVTQALRAEKLNQLLLSDVPPERCTLSEDAGTGPESLSYSVARAVEFEIQSNPRFARVGTEGQGDNAAAPSRSERYLVIAALAFAITLLLLTATELAGPSSNHSSGDPEERRASLRWQPRWAALALVGFTAGTVLVVSRVQPRDLLVSAVIFVAAMVMTFPSLSRYIGRRNGSQPDDAPSSSSLRPQATRWWADLFTALTIVGFAGAALGFSVVSDRERNARAEADRQTALSERLFELGERAALRDLATVGDLAELEARVAAANQAGLPDAAEDIETARDVIEDHVQATEAAVRVDLEPLIASPADRDACPTEDVMPRLTSPDELLEASDDDPWVFRKHILARTEPGKVCAVLAALSRDDARRWNNEASIFTVALVVFGLAGFLLGLAADPDRTPASASWLLRVGVIGSLAGAIIASSVPLRALSGRDQTPGRAEAVNFAHDLAAGNVALSSGDCATAVDRLDNAIERYRGYGPAFVDRSQARVCNDNDQWLITPGSSFDVYRLSLADLEAARDLGVADSTVLVGVGWFRLVGALAEAPPDRDALRDAEATVKKGLDALEDARAPHVHPARFNLALAHLALGEPDAERLYQHALACLDPNNRCPGGGVNVGLRASYALSALADLELLQALPSRTVDTYRELLVNPGKAPDDRERPSLDDEWELSTFPQELQVEHSSDDAPPFVTIVWYHRASDDEPWSVVTEPSFETLWPGFHTDLPWPIRRLLPTGEYRADLHEGGRKIASVIKYHKAPEGYHRIVVPGLGLSAVVPDKWELQSELMEFGVTGAYGPPGAEPNLVLGRKDGTYPSGDVNRSLGEALDVWAAELGGPLGEVREVPISYFIKPGLVAKHEYPEIGGSAGIFFSPYLPKEVDAYPECGGTAFMASIAGVDPDASELIEQSLVLETAPFRLEALNGDYESPTFSLDIPEGWAALERPAGSAESQLTVSDCVTGANFRASTEENSSYWTADQHVDDALSFYSLNFDEFRLIDRRSVQLASGEAAIDITYSWVSGGRPVLQKQRHAVSGSNVYFITFTSSLKDASGYMEVVDQLLRSFEIADQ